MKRFLGLVLIAFISTNIFAIDFGGLISSDSSFDKQGSDDFVFTEKLDSSAYIKIPFSKDGKISLASEFLYRFQYSDSKINHYLDLPLFKFNFSGDVGTGVLDIYAGRYSVSDSTAKIFNQTSDGMFVSYSTAPFVTSFYIGYTGLVNRYLVSMVEGDITEYSGFSSDFYTSSLPYLALAANASMPNLVAGQNLGLGFWGFIGIQNLESNKYYGTVTINGPIAGNLYHTTEGIFAAITRKDTTRMSGFASAKLSYYFNWLGLSANAGLSYASEDFETVTATSGLVNGAPWTNVMVPTLSMSILPLPSLYIGAEANVPLTADEMEYTGVGVVGMVSYQLFSDVSLGISANHFAAKEEAQKQTKISIRASISF